MVYKIQHKCNHVCIIHTFFTTGTILKTVIVFRGKGVLPAAEKAQYNSRVIVLFQSSAWADRNICNEWIDEVLAPAFSIHYILLHTLYLILYRK